MSQTDFDQLIRQLTAEDPQERRSAAKQLGELKRPEAIPELASVYRGDSDDTVRKAAADALRVFRRMEQEYGADEDGTRKGGPSSATLSRIRGLLIITLALTVLGNVALVVTRAFPSLFTPPKAPQTAPTPRDQLTDSFGKRIEAARAEATTLRGVYSGLQGMGAQSLIVNQPQCQKLQSSDVNPVDLGELDAVTYPDLKTVNDQTNQAVLGLVPLRNTFVVLCNTKDPGEVDRQLAAQGGAAKIITAIDSITNKDLSAAQASLKRAIDSPAPTVGPTSTPTPLPTSTPAPTATPAPPTATIPATVTAAGVTPAGATQAAGATGAATGASTGAATGAATLGNTITFNGLGLETLKSYRYLISATGQGSFASTGKTFNASLKIAATRQASPLAAEYDIVINDANSRDFNAAPSATTPLLRGVAGSLYVQGNWTYTIADNVFYQVNNATGKCQKATPIAGDKAPFQDFTFGDLADVTLTLQPPDEQINGVTAKHYHGEKKGGFNNQFSMAFDVYLAADSQLPVRVIEVVTQPTFGAKTPSLTGFTDFKLTIQYDLQAQNLDVKVARPVVCPK